MSLKAAVIKVPSTLPEVLADVAKLRNPALAAAAVAMLIEIVSPFGLNVGPDGAVITGVLTAVGALAAAVQKAITK